MSDQGKVVITMTVPASSAFGTAIAGTGAKSATLKAVGLMADSTAAGVTTGPVQISGTALGIAAETITAGQALKADADGKLAVATTGAGNDDHLICAIALEGASANELFSVKIV